MHRSCWSCRVFRQKHNSDQVLCMNRLNNRRFFTKYLSANVVSEILYDRRNSTALLHYRFHSLSGAYFDRLTEHLKSSCSVALCIPLQMAFFPLFKVQVTVAFPVATPLTTPPPLVTAAILNCLMNKVCNMPLYLLEHCC